MPHRPESPSPNRPQFHEFVDQPSRRVSLLTQETIHRRRQGGGPSITLDSTLRKIDRDFEEPGFSQESRSISLNASHSLLDKKLNLNLGYTFSDTEDFVRPVYSVTRSELRSNIRYQILPGLTTRAGYRLPIQWRFGQFSGDHDIDWQLNWLRNHPLINFPLDVTFEYRGGSL